MKSRILRITRRSSRVRAPLGGRSKDRLLPLGGRALHWVQRYLDRARPLLAWNLAEPTLLLGSEGRALNPVWLSTVVAQYVERAELGKHGGCHLFRHSMATLMLENGADIRFIQAMLGHAELSTTQIYTQVAIRQLQQVHAATHPGAKRREVGGEAQGRTTPEARDVLWEALEDEADE
ncbi:tyrosine-type recombinase/integrase [Cupriavidus sp. 30B13]|uniref:tyrosine-type recombinase/integrase n=1 Tax=Cupriavidus sp. 30B13 TaxID=3384241 RepID=UPI003B91FE03